MIRLIPALAISAVLWSVSSWGYYALVAALALERGYDQAPFMFFFYYLAWSILAMVIFRKALSRQLTASAISYHAAALLPVLFLFGLFVTLVIPIFPEVSVFRAPPNPPEFMFSSGWYYVPKATDILFQQVMVAGIIRTAAHFGMSHFKIGVLLAALFGGMHLTLALDGFTTVYVARFSISAVIFGFCAPFLYLRLRHGFRWAYAAHFTFYLLDATITHFVLATPAPS